MIIPLIFPFPKNSNTQPDKKNSKISKDSIQRSLSQEPQDNSVIYGLTKNIAGKAEIQSSKKNQEQKEDMLIKTGMSFLTNIPANYKHKELPCIAENEIRKVKAQNGIIILHNNKPFDGIVKDKTKNGKYYEMIVQNGMPLKRQLVKNIEDNGNVNIISVDFVKRYNGGFFAKNVEHITVSPDGYKVSKNQPYEYRYKSIYKTHPYTIRFSPSGDFEFVTKHRR